MSNNSIMTVLPVNVMSDSADRVLRTGAYARVSTDKDDQANSFESQVQYFTDYIQRQNDWELVKVYSDEGITGTNTTKRDGFNDMVEDALSGKLDLVITKEVSRFARNIADAIHYTRLLKEHNVDIVFALDGIDTRDSNYEFKLAMISAIAQEESRKTSERVKWGQARRMEQGVVFGRNLLGYKVLEGKLYLVEDEAEIVKLIFHKYLNEGKGTHIIARELKEEGIKPYDPDGRAKYKNDWSNTQILRVLRNEKYVGDLCQKKTYTKNFLDHKKRYNRGAEEKIYIRDHHPEIAIISRDMWDATQAELQRRTTTAEQKSKHSNRYWASGKIFCGVCGERFVNKIKKTSVGTSRAWNCLNHVKAAAFRNAECSMSEWASDRSLKNIVLYILNILVENKDELRKEIIKDIAELSIEEKTKSADDIQGKIDRLEHKKDNLLDMCLTDVISKSDFKIKNDKINAEISVLQTELEEIKELATTKQRQQDRMDNIIKEIDRVLQLDSEDLDGLLGTVTQSITVYEGHTVVVRLKDIPFNFRVAYKSTGKLDTYRTEILSLEVV